MVLDFDIVETSQLTLLERAKLFIKLKYCMEQKKRAKKLTFKELVQTIKFKTTRHNFISDSVLPSKSAL